MGGRPNASGCLVSGREIALTLEINAIQLSKNNDIKLYQPASKL
jgi:hypothetical protein